MSLYSSYCASQWCLVTETGQPVGLLPTGYLWSWFWGALGERPKARNWQGAVAGRKWGHCQRGQVRVHLNEMWSLGCGEERTRKNTVQEGGGEIWLTNPPPMGKHRQKRVLLFNQRCLLKGATPVAQGTQSEDWVCRNRVCFYTGLLWGLTYDMTACWLLLRQYLHSTYCIPGVFGRNWNKVKASPLSLSF